MNEKNYKQYAEQVNGCNRLFADEVKRAADETTKILTDWRYSEKGKEEKKQKALAELNATAENMTAVFKEAVKKFCDDFAVVLPEDGKDHSKDIENALKVIEMLGYGMDERNLDNIINPLRGSFRSMKTIVDVMEAKNKNALAGVAGVGYDAAIMGKLYEYMGINTRVNDYIDLFAHVEAIIDNTGDRYRFNVTSMSNATVVTMVDVIPYSFLACADWMQQIGEEYAALEDEFSSLFKNHVPSDKELILNTLRGEN